MWTLLSLLTALIVTTRAQIITFTPEEVAEAYTAFRITPYIIPDPPATGLIDIFGDIQTRLGNRIDPWCTTVPPYTTWVDADSKALYTTLALDPDMPQYFAANGTQFLHSLTVNVPGLSMEKGDLLTPFIPCSPLPGSGDHRIICLIYKQLAPIPVTNKLLISISQNIWTFSVMDFVKRYKLGTPVSGGLFRTRQTLDDTSTDACECDGMHCHTHCLS